ncbi:Hsp70 family protein [Candidatus Frankia nodulisporulans]|uniref:Hsp70 family protein n=1 Tax=Candidatus Frankia nodulisporulans TaxID=2060052 RepID=UPI001CDB9665|nr:Hsp70 family protein [Candidatus Frankia nodulisporulans]
MHTIVGIADGGWPRVLELGGQRRLPSVVYAASGGGLLFARAAARRARTDPDRAATDLLRRLGDEGQVVLGGAAYRRESLLGRLVAHLVTTAAQQLGGPPDQVVVTHPAFWPASRREAFTEAVTQLSGLEMPVTAVAAADAMGTLLARSSVTQTVDLVGWYDLGAGFLDTAVLSFSPFGFQVVGTAAGMRHGIGIDLDGLLVDQALTHAGIDPQRVDRSDPATRLALAQLRRDAAQAKEVLAEEAEVDLTVALPGVSTAVTLTRAELEALTTPTIDDTVGALRRALRSVPAEPADLSRILLSGGVAYLPLVSRRLREAFPALRRIEHRSDADLAMGAALLAADFSDRAARAGGGVFGGEPVQDPYDVTAVIRPPDAASLSSLPPFMSGGGTTPLGRTGGRGDVPGTAAGVAAASAAMAAASGGAPTDAVTMAAAESAAGSAPTAPAGTAAHGGDAGATAIVPGIDAATMRWAGGPGTGGPSEPQLANLAGAGSAAGHGAALGP